MTVVIVESPAKAKTINKYLGKDYTVLASFGHVRDLPSKDGSVRPDEDFAMTWEITDKASKRLSDIATAVKSANRVILATDPDREGEAISWHVLEILKSKKVLKDKIIERVTFNAITPQAVRDAMNAPRQIDMELVEAYLARRALDYLVGFTLSPVLWRKLPGARSAGRVQSVALKLIVDREVEIEAFKTQEYWSILTEITAKSPPFTTRLHTFEGKKLDKLGLKTQDEALAAKAAIEKSQFSIINVEKKPARRNPQPPFTTSTLQQEAARKCGFAAARTMQTAQKLYEGVDIGGETVGLITYMRTDGVSLSSEAINEIRATIKDRFGPAYVPDSARLYKAKSKNAQEAHEAIRPTSMALKPENLRLDPDQAKLYELIYRRTLASQMEAARVEKTVIDAGSLDQAIILRATGQVISFDGYLAVYEEGRDDEKDEDANTLPTVYEGTEAKVEDIRPNQHFTEPPPRFSEASLVKKLEELGIGRPSTYASILSTLRDRQYVRMDKNRFVPESQGRLVTAFLERFFSKYVEYDFTAELEERLDLVSDGSLNWKHLLSDFWRDFHKTTLEIADHRVSVILDHLNDALAHHIFPTKEGQDEARACPKCAAGQLSLKTSRSGAFIGCSNYPECNYTRSLGVHDPDNPEESREKELGTDPETGLNVWLKIGRFGPYVERNDGEKPKRSSLPKGWSPSGLDLEAALKLLALPRLVGNHPEDAKPIKAGLGRFGPFIEHCGTYVNLASAEEVFEIGLNRAVTLLAEKRAGGRGKPAQEPLKDLGLHPQSNEPIHILSGRYGAYIKCGAINATLPKDKEPRTVTLEEALTLIEAKEAQGPSKKPTKKASTKRPATKAASKKTVTKKTAAKKPAAKKSTKA
jgi:DNA topoisomerase-1